MARIPFATRNDVDADERPAYDAFVAARYQRLAISGPTGPYALLLHMPELAQRLEALRLYLRDEPSLPQPLQSPEAYIADALKTPGNRYVTLTTLDAPS